ncbi:MAG: cyclic nucleotide-binding domain-containing protein [Kofleriaceae bacterium]|nr:cyclic nucleotide-binding domain-containing protein [Kofleriaceae bacterium]
MSSVSVPDSPGSNAAQVTGVGYGEFLAGLPFFAGIPAEEIAAFAQNVLVRNFPADHDIIVQRTYGHSMFVLISGAVDVHATDGQDNQLRLGRIDRPGDFFGEAALLGRGERTATVTSAVDVCLLEIEKHRFDLFSRRHKSVRTHLEGVYHARAIATYARMHRYLGMLDDNTRREITAGAKLQLFSRDDTAAKSGEAADSILVIKDGVLKAVRRGADGTVSILAYFNTHDVVGVHDQAKREFDLVAVGQCEVLALPRGPFAMAMAKNHEISAHFGKDDMHRRAAMAEVGGTVFQAAQAFLQAGVEVESLLVINLDRCVRCGNCVRACHSRHKYTRLDRRGPIFRRRAALKAGKYEHVMLPSSCRHCRDPECMIGCPTGAIQRFADGDVDINDNCIGCENCARKCPYGNITMRPLEENERPSPEVTKRAIKCNLCRGFGYSNCVHECPRGALVRVDPLRYFEELALVMEAEQRDAIEWSRKQAKNLGTLGTKQQIAQRSTWFMPTSVVLGVLALAAIVVAVVSNQGPLRGGTRIGLILGAGAAVCLLAASSLGLRKRMRNAGVGGLEAWTQFHMMFGAIGFVAAAAHAGFRVTGIFTTLLLLAFALEVATGVLGQIIYVTVPKMLTQLERHGQARLVEDLLDEQQALQQSIDELRATVSPETWAQRQASVARLVGSLRDRLRKTYDPVERIAQIKTGLQLDQANPAELSSADRGTIERIAESHSKLLDTAAQLKLHRRLKTWLIVHVAVASALVIMLATHIVTALTLLP